MQLVQDKSLRSILDHATLMTDDQVERLMKSNPVADGDDGKQFGTQCVGTRDIVGIKLYNSYLQAENASLPARRFFRLVDMSA